MENKSKLYYEIIIGIILISILSILISAPEQKQEITSSLITTDVSKGIYFDINKSGIEEYLDINYEELNENTTRFCISLIDRVRYLSELPKGTNIRRIPITKIDNSSFFNLVSDIDLSNDNVCFNVTYFTENGFSFKIGFNSALITATFDTDATEGIGKNIYRDIWGNLNVAYTSAGNDFGFANSSDNGTTWTAIEKATRTYDNFGITRKSSVGLFVYYSSANDIDGYFSTNNGTTWTSVTSLIDTTGGFIEPSCDVDSNNKYHCCAWDQSDNSVWYANSSAWNSEIQVYKGNSAGVSRCFLSINQNNSISILIADNFDDNLTFEVKTTSDSGFGANPIYKGSGTDFPDPPSVSMSISSTQDVYGNDVIIAFGNKTNTVICTYPLYCNQITSSYFATSSVAWNSLYQAIVLTGNSSVAGGYSYKSITNSPFTTTWTPTWTTSSLNSKSDFPSIANQIFPVQARLNDWAYIVYTNATGLFFLKENMTLPVVESTCTYSSGNWAVNCADYCNITTNVNGDGSNFTAIGVGWFKMSANISGFKKYKFAGGCNATCTSSGCIRI